MVRASVAIAFACALGHAGVARAGGALAVNGGIGTVFSGQGGGGRGSGVLADAEYVVWRDRWFTPRLYAGTELAKPRSNCGEGVTPCDVSARFGYLGGKARLMLPLRWVGPFLELGAGASAGSFHTQVGDVVDIARSGVTYHVSVGVGLALGARHQWQVRFLGLEHTDVGQASGSFTLGYEFAPERLFGPEPAIAAAPPEPPPALSAEVPADAPAPEPAPTGALVAVPAPEPPAEEAPAPRERGGWYLGGWLGYGGGTVNRPDGTTDFFAQPVMFIPTSLGAGFGVTAARQLLVGAEWNLIYGTNCGAQDDCHREVVLQQLLATATWFPLFDGSPTKAFGGPLLRVGTGLAILNSTYEPPKTSSSETTPPPPPPLPDGPATVDWHRVGACVLAGLGYSFPIRRAAGAGSSRALEIGLDLAWQWYGASEVQPPSSFSTVLRFGLAFY